MDVVVNQWAIKKGRISPARSHFKNCNKARLAMPSWIRSQSDPRGTLAWGFFLFHMEEIGKERLAHGIANVPIEDEADFIRFPDVF